jgi:hypothetical protein
MTMGQWQAAAVDPDHTLLIFLQATRAAASGWGNNVKKSGYKAVVFGSAELLVAAMCERWCCNMR